MSYFYSKYIAVESVLDELHQLDLSDEEKAHLSKLIDSSLHHTILDEILSSLEDKDKQLFLKLLSEDPQSNKLINFLKERVENIEEKIKRVTDDLITEMHKDIKEAKKLKETRS